MGLELAILFLIGVVIVVVIMIRARDKPSQSNARSRRFRRPEDLGRQQDAIDARLGRNEFFVYVLDTSYGHYVGHTARPRARFNEHLNNRVESTRDARPEKAWLSRPLTTRREASSFEAALKCLRDSRSPRFAAITALDPRPWKPNGWN